MRWVGRLAARCGRSDCAACRCVGAGPRAVSRRGLAVAALACGEGALRCSLREGGCDAAVGTAERGAHLTALAGPAGTPGFPSLRCAARRRPCAPSGHRPRAWSRRCPAEPRMPRRLPARLRAGGPGQRMGGAEQRRAPAARASALRELTRGNCLSGASAARAASFAAGRGTEHTGQSARSADRRRLSGRAHPPRSLARAEATTANASQEQKCKGRLSATAEATKVRHLWRTSDWFK